MNIQTDDLRPRANEAASLMRALSSPHRLMILCELLQGERSVGQLELVVRLRQSALSQHLAKLRADGLVSTRRESQTIHYSLADPAVAKVIGTLHELYCQPRRKSKR